MVKDLYPGKVDENMTEQLIALLLLQRLQVLFAAPTWWFTAIHNAGFGGSDALF